MLDGASFLPPSIRSAHLGIALSETGLLKDGASNTKAIYVTQSSFYRWPMSQNVVFNRALHKKMTKN